MKPLGEIKTKFHENLFNSQDVTHSNVINNGKSRETDSSLLLKVDSRRLKRKWRQEEIMFIVNYCLKILDGEHDAANANKSYMKRRQNNKRKLLRMDAYLSLILILYFILYLKVYYKASCLVINLQLLFSKEGYYQEVCDILITNANIEATEFI